MKNIKILGVNVNSLPHREMENKLDEFFKAKKSKIICTPNTEFIIKAQKDAEFRQILNDYSSLNLPDGIGLLWAARFDSLWRPKNKFLKYLIIIFQWAITIFLIPFWPNFFKTPIEERIAGSDLIWSMCRYAAKRHINVFLLGGLPTIAERAALKLQTDIENLKIVGVDDGGSPKSQLITSLETVEIIEAINKSKADLLFVAFGAPKQEKWLKENLSRTKCKIGIGVGGTFDFIAGARQRAPLYLQKSGLEWFYRLIQEPSRIVRQTTILKFMWLVLLKKLMSN